jgi:hypothetical protein
MPRAAIAGAVSLALAAGCGGGDQGEPDSQAPHMEDPGPLHIHGLGIDPADGALMIATHTGLFRAPAGETDAVRVGDRYQDTMAFTVVGPRRFLGSGHPDGRDRLPPFLGLIESRDGGVTWKPVSLLGKVDFHVLEISGRRVYGFGSDFESRKPRFLVSDDRGRTWRRRTPPEPLVSLTVDPQDKDTVLAAGESAAHISRDAGRNWQEVDAPQGFLTWPGPGRLFSVDERGLVSRSSDRGGSWEAVGSVGGAVAALDDDRGKTLLAALHDGTIKQSTDGGRSWEVRSRPGPPG